MTEVEERLAHLEGRVQGHSHMLNGVREAIVHLEQRMDARFEGVDRRFVSIDRRFEAIDRRFEAIDRRFESLDQKIDHRFEALDTKLSRQFYWLVGVQVTTLTAVVAALAAR